MTMKFSERKFDKVWLLQTDTGAPVWSNGHGGYDLRQKYQTMMHTQALEHQCGPECRMRMKLQAEAQLGMDLYWVLSNTLAEYYDVYL